MTQHITQEQIEAIYARYGGEMTNCAHAIARQAVANYIDQRAKDLPELPDPYGIGAYPYPDTFTRAQTFTYGQQCAAQARELALSEAIQAIRALWHGDGDGERKCIYAIEALKGK